MTELTRHLIAADGRTITPFEPPKSARRGYTLTQLHEACAADTVEIITLPASPDWMLVVDEAGWARAHATPNLTAIRLASEYGWRGSLTGAVLVIKRSDLR